MNEDENESFNRWSCLDPNTNSYRVFNKHHCEINNYIWSFVPLQSFGEYLVRHDKSDKTIHDIFHVSGIDSRRVEKSKALWMKNFKSFQNLCYINALTSILSYLEFYIKRIGTISLLSDPGVMIGESRAVDGTKLIKNTKAVNTEKIITSLVKGTWHDRARNFELVFLELPSSIRDNIETLEKIRKIRNRAAHSFSRMDNGVFVDRVEDKFHDKVELESLKKYMSLISDIAVDIDKQLLRNNIGEFESIYIYHSNQEKFRGFNNEKARQFGTLLNSSYVGNIRSKKFCKQLIDYYSGL